MKDEERGMQRPLNEQDPNSGAPPSPPEHRLYISTCLQLHEESQKKSKWTEKKGSKRALTAATANANVVEPYKNDFTHTLR